MAAAATCVLGVLAFASSAQAAVSGSHVIATLYSTSALELSGYTPDVPLDITIIRAGVTIAHATGAAAADGSLNVNPSACWIGTTPAILAQDVVSVAGDGPTDTMVVQDVTAGRPAKGTAANTIVVHGTGRDAAGNQLPAGTIESRLITTGKFADSKKSKRATAVYDSPTSTNWTATFTNVTGGDVSLALAASSRGVYSALVSEVTISENPGGPGPSAPCTAPLASNGVTASDHVYKGAPTVNGANVATDVGLSGIAQADATAVSVKVTGPGAGTTSAVAATLSTGTGAKTWTATIPAAEVAALADGTLTATATYTTPGGPIGGGTLSLLKDTAAPAAPVASPAGGTYTATQSVSLFDTDSGAAMFYTTNGSAPATSVDVTTKAFSAPIAVSSSLAIKALAVDTAGNPSAVSTDTYSLVASPSLTPGGIDYGSQQYNTASPGLTVTLKNDGAADMTVSGVSVTGANPGDFVRGVSTCSGVKLTPGSSCTVDNVRFIPQANGTRTAALTFTDDAPGGSQSVPLTGDGFGAPTAPPPPPPTAPVASVSATAIDFGAQDLNTTSTVHTVTVTNTGTAAMSIPTTGVSGAGFALGANTCAGNSAI
ncbi:MAG: hypothetical protein QOE11_973, partial [Solirubrobacteraceae bacterium]|nr:hypothetical protein [Solirubrobacteraceae bacterium]